MTKIYIAALFVASTCLSATAQELSTEVIVDRTVEAELPAANPLPGLVPSSPWKDISPQLPRRSEYSLWADFAPITARSGGADFTGLAAPDTLPGYISLGYFPAYNVGIQAGYSHAFSRSTTIAGALMFDGMNYHSHADDKRETVRDNTFGIALRGSYRHRSSAVTSFRLSFLNASLKNPAYTGVSQSQGIANIIAGVTTERVSKTLSYKADVTFRYTGLDKDIAVPDLNALGSRNLNPASETMLRFGGRISYSLGHFAALSLNADATMLDSDGHALDDEQFAAVQRKTRAIIGARPSFDFRYHGIDIRLGLRVDWSLNTPGSSIHIAPDASARWRFIPKGAVYGTVGGGQKFYTLYDQMQMSVFAPGYQVFTPTFSPIEAKAGLRFGSFNGLTADIHGSYSSTKNMPMAVISSRVGTAFIPVNLSGWGAGLSIGYSSTKIDAGISATAYPHSYDKGSAACADRAKYVLGGHVCVRPHSKFDATLNYELRASRRYYFLSPISAPSSVGMGNVSDLGLRLNYRHNDVLSVFCRVENMLCRRVYILPHLTSAGMHGLVGATMQF